MTSFVLGVNTCFAVKRWPLPEEWARIVRDDLGLELVQHSFDLVDLDGPEADIERQAVEVRSACDAFGLDLQSTFTGLAAYSSNLLLDPRPQARRRAEQWYQRAVEFTAAAGGRATGGHVGAYTVADWASPQRRRHLAIELSSSLERIAASGASCGLGAIYVENLAAAREPSTIEDIEHLIRDGDETHAAIELCLDVGHQCVPGTSGDDRDPYAWLRRFGDRCSMVQLQQSDATADHHWPFTEASNAAGRIDATRVLESLDDSRLPGIHLVLEVIPPFEADDRAVRVDLVESVAYWRRALDVA